ncbi:uncharacterized protein [Primulina huaijiensis]|uniref:uncharacterized protein n=1 Tax=Primulina huaijiensis TaxID=1492673 RepID=UPI003CC73129
MNELGRQKFEENVCTLAIWKERTSLLHTERGSTRSKSIGWCMDFLGEYQSTKCMERPTSDSTIVESLTRWLPPPTGYLRLDVDASYNTNINAYEIGGAVRDHQGKMICAFGQKIKQPLSVTHGELIALHEGLKILGDRNYQGVYVASNSLLTVQAVTKLYEDFGYMGTIAAETGELMKGPMVSHLYHIKRSANTVAHVLAKFYVSSLTPIL